MIAHAERDIEYLTATTNKQIGLVWLDLAIRLLGEPQRRGRRKGGVVP